MIVICCHHTGHRLKRHCFEFWKILRQNDPKLSEKDVTHLLCGQERPEGEDLTARVKNFFLRRLQKKAE